MAVIDAGPHPYGTAIRIDQRVDRLDLGCVFFSRQGINIQHRNLPVLDLALVTLGQPEINKNRINVFNIDDVRAVLQVVPCIDLADSHNPVKGCQDFQTGGGGLCQRQLGLGHLQVGGTFIQRALADEVLSHQFLVAFLVGLRNRQLSLALLELGQRQLVVKLHQHLALAHTLAIGEIKLCNAPAHLGPEHYTTA